MIANSINLNRIRSTCRFEGCDKIFYVHSQAPIAKLLYCCTRHHKLQSLLKKNGLQYNIIGG